MNKGTIGFSRNNSFVSKAIRWITRQKWSHTFVVLEYDEDVGDNKVIEASAGGIRINSFKAYRGGYTVHLCELPGVDTEAGVSMAKSMLGRKYGYLKILGYIPVVLLRRIGIPVENSVTKGVVCSELVSYFMAAATGDASWRTHASENTPGDVKQGVEAMEGANCTHLK